MDTKYTQRWMWAAVFGFLAAGCNPDWSDRVPEVNAQTPQSEAGSERAAKPSRSDAGERQFHASGSGVTAQPAESADDAALSSRVESALGSEPDLHGSAIAVRTQDGVVTLSGTTRHAELRSMAAQVALSIDGVKHVRNEIALAREA
jgi:osmotically-inducible protein OsmY